MFVASVFHVGSIPTPDIEYKCPVAKKGRVETPGRETRLTAPTQVGRLAAGSLGHYFKTARRCVILTFLQKVSRKPRPFRDGMKECHRVENQQRPGMEDVLP